MQEIARSVRLGSPRCVPETGWELVARPPLDRAQTLDAMPHPGGTLDRMETVRLWRPVGENELALIRDTGFKRFPPRLDWQPIFYPVLSEDYATRIARDWNTKDDGTGYVTTFEVDASFIAKYEPHEAGGHELREYWIPAGDLVSQVSS